MRGGFRRLKLLQAAARLVIRTSRPTSRPAAVRSAAGSTSAWPAKAALTAPWPALAAAATPASISAAPWSAEAAGTAASHAHRAHIDIDAD